MATKRYSYSGDPANSFFMGYTLFNNQKDLITNLELLGCQERLLKSHSHNKLCTLLKDVCPCLVCTSLILVLLRKVPF